MPSFQWIPTGATWALTRDGYICQYIRWSESANQLVDMKGRELGDDLDTAKKSVEESMDA